MLRRLRSPVTERRNGPLRLRDGDDDGDDDDEDNHFLLPVH